MDLKSLIERVVECSASPDEIELYKKVYVECVDAYFSAAGYSKCRRHEFVEDFLLHGNASESARRFEMSDRTARDWATDFCAFASHWLRWRDECDKDDEARDLQCSESCGRKHFDGTTGGDKRTSGAKTKKLDRPDWTRCMDCPRRRDDVAVVMRGPGTRPAEDGAANPLRQNPQAQAHKKEAGPGIRGGRV